jgi:hypothetical protein
MKEKDVSTAAAIMGRRGGMVRSEAQNLAALRNIVRHNAMRDQAMTPSERKARRKAQRAARRITRAHK